MTDADLIRVAELRARHPRGVTPDRGILANLAQYELLTLLDALEASATAVGEAAVVIEVLRGQDAVRPYRELSPEMREHLVTAANTLREAASRLGRFDFGVDQEQPTKGERDG